MRFASLCLLLTALCMACSPANAESPAYRIVPRTHWAYRAYLRLCRANLAQPATVCYPSKRGAAWDARHGTVTRYELAVVTLRAEKTLADWDRLHRSTARRRGSLHRLLKRLDAELKPELREFDQLDQQISRVWKPRTDLSRIELVR